MGIAVPEAPDTGLRQVVVGSYRILYLPQATRIDIVAVVHGRQALGREVREPDAMRRAA